MATNPVLSKNMTLSYNSKVIAKCTDFTLEINKEIIDITTISDQDWKSKLAGLKEWKINFNALVTRGSDSSNTVYDALLADIKTNDTPVTVAVNDAGVGGTINSSGTAILASLQMGVKVGDKVTYSGSLEGTGALS